MQGSEKMNPGQSILSVVLYILAGIVLLAGVLLAVSFFNAPNSFFTAQIAFQGPLFKALFNQIFQLLRGIGIGILVISVLLSGALVGLGRMASQNARLKARVAYLEAQLGTGQPPRQIEP